MTIITPHLSVGRRLGPDATADLAWVYPRVIAAGVRIVTGAWVERIETDEVVLAHVHGEGGSSVAADTVVLCMLRWSDDRLYHELSDGGLAVRRIGDCVAPREVDDALLDGVREGSAA